MSYLQCDPSWYDAYISQHMNNVCVYMYIYIYIYMCVYIYIYIYKTTNNLFYIRYAAYLHRVRAMFGRTKNHTCVMGWSSDPKP